jgi:nitrogen regulatory protein PII
METTTPRVQVLTLILTPEQVKSISQRARKLQLSSTKLLAKGTVESHFLHALGITSDRREIVTMVLRKEDAGQFLDALHDKLDLDEPGNGIAFLTDVLACMGTHNGTSIVLEENPSLCTEECMYKKITVIVDRGNAEDVMTAARSAGARGGTILHGRGSSYHEYRKIFGIEVEPEKDMVIILTPKDITQKVLDAIAGKLDIDVPGNGIMYVEPVAATRGLFENRK